MSTPRFDLVDVTQTLRNRRRLILIVAVVAAVLGGVFKFIGKKEYKAEASFLMANPLYTDKNNLFQGKQVTFVDYFAGDDDVDRLMSLVESDTVKYVVSRKLGLAEAYGLDMSKPRDAEKLRDIFKDNYKVTRNEYNSCVLAYTDTDPVRAAAVVNECVKTIEEIFRSYYVAQRKKVIISLQGKIAEMDSTISVLTDTLATMRDKYKIYDLVSPARENMMAGSMKSSGVGDFGKAMEQVQNIEAVKDQLLVDKVQYMSILNQYLTTTNTDNISLVYSLSNSRVPAKPKGPGMILTVIACAMIGVFFSSLYILITSYYRLLISVER